MTSAPALGFPSVWDKATQQYHLELQLLYSLFQLGHTQTVCYDLLIFPVGEEVIGVCRVEKGKLLALVGESRKLLWETVVKRFLALALTNSLSVHLWIHIWAIQTNPSQSQSQTPYLNWDEAEKVIILASIPFKIQIFMHESNTTDLNRIIHVYNFMHTFNLWRNRP